MQRKRVSPALLQQELLKLLERPETTLEFLAKRGDTAGNVTYDSDFWPRKCEVTIDANNQPVVQFVIHELLHILFLPFLGFADDTLEEVMICALDAYMYNYVAKSKRRLAKWNALIEQKLAEVDKGPPPTLEEMVNRP